MGIDVHDQLTIPPEKPLRALRPLVDHMAPELGAELYLFELSRRNGFAASTPNGMQPTSPITISE
jgi:hypothetical protein